MHATGYLRLLHFAIADIVVCFPVTHRVELGGTPRATI